MGLIGCFWEVAPLQRHHRLNHLHIQAAFFIVQSRKCLSLQLIETGHWHHHIGNAGKEFWRRL